MTAYDARLATAALLRWFDELADTGIFTTDRDLVVRTWNRWLEAQTGQPAASVVGLPLREVCPSIAARGLDVYYAEALSGQPRVLSERFHKYLIPVSRSFHATGLTEMAQSARIAPLETEGRIIGTITVIEDVTERVVSEREMRAQIARSERAREVAEEASRLKDEFLATLSHEIRTPLNAVLGWAQMLRTQPQLRSRAHALEVIERNAAAQMRLVEDLLDMARVISGKLRLEIVNLRMEDVVAAAMDVIAPAAAAKQLTVSLASDDGLPPVSGDPDRLQQVVWNLLSNAVKFTDTGGRIDIGIRRSGDGLDVVVRDTGEGISSEFLPHVFDRFRQADSSPSRRHGGLGLGLALVRQMVELHGGSVTADSEGPQRGSTFTVHLPVAAPGARVPPARPGGDEAVTLNGISVLVVDDNEDARELVVTAMRDYGAQAHGVSSVADALQVLGEGTFRPDIVVSDLGLPDADGYEFIRRIRATPELGKLPAIAVTAYANPEDRIRALAAGYQTHLPKPVDLAVLAASIAALLPSKPRSTAQSGPSESRLREAGGERPLKPSET